MSSTIIMSDIEQNSDAWRKIRAGKLTASRMSDALAKTKTGWGASRANLMAQLIAERLTGEPQESYQNEAMRWGTEKEPDARDAYAFQANVHIVQVGFVEHTTIAMAGASPDGLVGDDGLIEIKAPNTATHIETLLGHEIPAKYRTQMLWQMACTGRKWCDFVSFDPRMPSNMQMFVKRLHRDDATIADMEREASVFLSEIDAKVQSLINLFRSDERVAA